MKGWEEKIVYVTFITAVTDECDCMPAYNSTFFDDVGVVASTDPIAIDQAAIDLANRQFGKDFFGHIHPAVDCTKQLRHGEKLGMGSREYMLTQI